MTESGPRSPRLLDLRPEGRGRSLGGPLSSPPTDTSTSRIFCRPKVLTSESSLLSISTFPYLFYLLTSPTSKPVGTNPWPFPLIHSSRLTPTCFQCPSLDLESCVPGPLQDPFRSMETLTPGVPEGLSYPRGPSDVSRPHFRLPRCHRTGVSGPGLNVEHRGRLGGRNPMYRVVVRVSLDPLAPGPHTTKDRRALGSFGSLRKRTRCIVSSRKVFYTHLRGLGLLLSSLQSF